MKSSYLIMALISSSLCRIAYAESYMEFLTGNVDTSNANVTASYSSLFSSSSASRDVSFDKSSYAGGRYVSWSYQQPSLGYAFEVGSLAVNSQDIVDIDGLVLSVQGFYRKSMQESERFPHGRLQPYVGLGYFLFSGSAYVDLSPDLSSTVDVGGKGHGLGFMAGMRWLMSDKMALLFELRSTRISTSFDNEDTAILSFTRETAHARLTSSYAMFGISFGY